MGLFVGGSIDAQSPTKATFDVASIRQSGPDDPDSIFATDGPGLVAVRPGGRFWAPSATTQQLIRVAYGVLDVEIVGGPRWIEEDRFRIEATARPDATADEVRAMLRTLLADRFGLAVHRETRELPVYQLVREHTDGRLGERIRQSGPECAPMPPPAALTVPGSTSAPPEPPPPPPPPPAGSGRSLVLSFARTRCGSPRMLPGYFSAREIAMQYFTAQLASMTGRPVVDRSGLVGSFDVDLTYAPDAPTVIPEPGDAPPLLTALREQLGLRLEPGRAPVNVLVIDRVERPREN